MRACTTRADTYTCVRCNCRTRQTGYPRGSSTPTPHRDTDSNTERGQGEGRRPSLLPLRIVRAGTPRLFCPSFFVHLSPASPPRGHAGVTRDPTQRLHTHTHTRARASHTYRPTHRATTIRNRDSDLSSRGVRCRFEDDALGCNFGRMRFSSRFVSSLSFSRSEGNFDRLKISRLLDE